MYCPRCGEQQNSGNLRFCSRCGLPMGLVAEVLSNGGTLPQLEELLKKNSIFTRKNGVFFSILWFILFVLIGTPFWGIMEVDELAGVTAIFGIFGSLIILLFSLFFLGKPAKDSINQSLAQSQQSMPQNLSGQQMNQNALPPQQSQPAQDFVSPTAGSWKSYDTGELAQPGSVTEGTTKLLQKEEQEEEGTKYFNK